MGWLDKFTWRCGRREKDSHRCHGKTLHGCYFGGVGHVLWKGGWEQNWAYWIDVVPYILNVWASPIRKVGCGRFHTSTNQEGLRSSQKIVDFSNKRRRRSQHLILLGFFPFYGDLNDKVETWRGIDALITMTKSNEAWKDDPTEGHGHEHLVR